MLPGSLHPPMSQMISNAVLHSRNIYSLYSHQVTAIESIRKGKHVVVSTSTASGKSVIYQVNNLIFLFQFRSLLNMTALRFHCSHSLRRIRRQLPCWCFRLKSVYFVSKLRILTVVRRHWLKTKRPHWNSFFKYVPN